MNPIILALAVGLAISGAANVFMLNRWLHATEVAAVATTTSNTNLDNAKQCSKSVDNLELEAHNRDVDAAADRAKASLEAKAAGTRGQTIMRTQPSVPGDDCKSAAVQVDDWLANRKLK